MKRILLDSGKNFYKANMHCHSTYSDGQMTVAELKRHYCQNGYSVIAFTDHEHLIGHAELNDDSFLALTACELAIKEFEGESTLKRRDMKVCHLNLYAKDPNNTKTPCYNSAYDHFIPKELCGQSFSDLPDYKREYSAEGISKIIRTANEQGFLVSYNHPRWSLENATDYLGYRGLWAVEVYNHTCNCDGWYEYDINVYDDFLRSGQRIACIAGDDNHCIETTCGGFTMINAKSLEYRQIMTALEQHEFYASNGPLIHHLEIEDDVATLTFSAGTYATLSTRGRHCERKPALHPERENTVQFYLFPDDGYVRFDVVDDRGHRANTCAYWI